MADGRVYASTRSVCTEEDHDPESWKCKHKLVLWCGWRFVVLCLNTLKMGTLARTKEAETELLWNGFSHLCPASGRPKITYPLWRGSPRNRLFLPSWLHFNATVLFSKAGRSFFAFRNCKLFSEYLLALYFSSHYLHQNIPSGKFIAMSDEFKQEPKCLLWPCFNIRKSGVVLLLQMRVGISITPSDNVST